MADRFKELEKDHFDAVGGGAGTGGLMCGANTRSGHGIEGAASSGRFSAEKILSSA